MAFKYNLLFIFIHSIVAYDQTLLPTICIEQNVCYTGSWIGSTNGRFASFQGVTVNY